jgi:hypothetical protein
VRVAAADAGRPRAHGSIVARVLRSRWSVAVAGSLVGSALTWAVVQGRGNGAAAEPARPSSVASGEIPTPRSAGTERTSESKLALHGDSMREDPSPASSALQPLQASAASSQPPEAAAPGGPDVTRVTLQVFPFDAKVTFRDGSWTGPVGEIDVPRGQRVALQITRKGYVARRLVLDGSRSKMAVGLVKQPSD